MSDNQHLGNLVTVMAVGLLAALTFDSQATADDDEQVENKLTVSAEILTAEKDQPPRLRITAVVAEGWHIFSVTQKPGGPKRTRIELSESKDFKLAGLWSAIPAPTIKRYDDIWPDLPVEEHQGRVSWSVPLTVMAGVDPAKLTIKGRIQSQACKELCIDVSLPFEARRARAGDTPR